MRKILPLAFLATSACSASETHSDATYCMHPGEDLQAYYELLSQNPQILEATKLCDRPVSFQAQLWDKVREAEESEMPPTAPLPAAYLALQSCTKTKPFSDFSLHNPTYQKIEMFFDGAEYDFYFPVIDKQQRKVVINDLLLERAAERFAQDKKECPKEKPLYISRSEAQEIYAAYLAHSLWLEVEKKVPWTITDYTQEQLTYLLQPKARFSAWDDEKEEYSFHLILDHSPRETFAVAREAVSSFSNQKSAMDEIIKSTRPFRHGVVQFDSEGNVIGGDLREIVTIPAMKEELISRHGCQTMSPYIVALANSLNIPGRYINGYYHAAGHRSALFDFTDDVLAHGDDVYYYNILGNTPSSEVMGSHDFWEENVLVFPRGDVTAAHNSMLYTYRKSMQYPSQGLIKSYCDDGREALEERFLYNEFGPFATAKEIDVLEKKILELSNNCDPPFPENNPDQ